MSKKGKKRFYKHLRARVRKKLGEDIMRIDSILLPGGTCISRRTHYTTPYIPQHFNKDLLLKPMPKHFQICFPCDFKTQGEWARYQDTFEMKMRRYPRRHTRKPNYYFDSCKDPDEPVVNLLKNAGSVFRMRRFNQSSHNST